MKFRLAVFFAFFSLLQTQSFATSKTCSELLGVLEFETLRITAQEINAIPDIYSDVILTTTPGVVASYGRTGFYLKQKDRQTPETEVTEEGELTADEYRNYISSNLNDKRVNAIANFLVGRASAADLNYFLDKADEEDLESLVYNILASDPSIRANSQFDEDWLVQNYTQQSQAIKSLGRSGQVKFIESAMAKVSIRFPLGGSITDIVISHSLEKFHIQQFHLFTNYGASLREFRTLIASAKKAGVDLNQSTSGRYSHIIQLYIQPLLDVTDRVEKVEILFNEGQVDPNVLTNSGRPLEYILEELRAGSEFYPNHKDPDFLIYYDEQLRIIRTILSSSKLDLHFRDEDGNNIYLKAIENYPFSEVASLIRQKIKD